MALEKRPRDQNNTIIVGINVWHTDYILWFVTAKGGMSQNIF